MSVALIIAGYLLFLGAVFVFLHFTFKSTPTHLVITRRPPPAKEATKEQVQPKVDWAMVRKLEWELDGRYWTGRDGTPLDEDDPAASIHEDVPVLRPDVDQDYRLLLDDNDRQVTGLPLRPASSWDHMTPAELAGMTSADFYELRRKMGMVSQFRKHGG